MCMYIIYIYIYLYTDSVRFPRPKDMVYHHVVYHLMLSHVSASHLAMLFISRVCFTNTNASSLSKRIKKAKHINGHIHITKTICLNLVLINISVFLRK